jgi:predicted metal-dependent phosphoesterase TrpH
MDGLTAYIYDGHGHSTASDGIHSPEKIIDTGLKKGLSIIGLSDHNVIKNLPTFLRHADSINKHEIRFLPVPSVEIGTILGDILIAIPDRNHAENFMAEFHKPKQRPHPIEIIEHNIERYNALIVILHPQIQYVKGLSIHNIIELLDKIPKSIKKTWV